MIYGYYNYYITNIGEEVPEIVAELAKCCDEIVTEELSYSPRFYELITMVTEGDTICVYDIRRSCGGLRDLIDTLKILHAKGVKFVSIKDQLTIDQTEKGQASLHSLIVANNLTCVDPIHGFYK